MVPDLMLHSPAGQMLVHIMAALVVLPVKLVTPVLPHLVALLLCLDSLCNKLLFSSCLQDMHMDPSEGHPV